MDTIQSIVIDRLDSALFGTVVNPSDIKGNREKPFVLQIVIDCTHQSAPTLEFIENRRTDFSSSSWCHANKSAPLANLIRLCIVPISFESLRGVFTT